MIPVIGEQAFGSSEKSSQAIRLYTTTFENKTKAVFVTCIAKDSRHIQVACNQIVVIGCKLHSPAVESKIINNGFPIFQNSNTSMVACPGVVGRHFHESDIAQFILAEKGFDLICVSAYNQ